MAALAGMSGAPDRLWLLFKDPEVKLTSRPLAACSIEFDPDIHYILPARSTLSVPVIWVVVHAPGISSLDCFGFASQFGRVLEAHWTPSPATVIYHSDEHAYRCFEDLVNKGYLAAISVVGTPYLKEIR